MLVVKLAVEHNEDGVEGLTFERANSQSKTERARRRSLGNCCAHGPLRRLHQWREQRCLGSEEFWGSVAGNLAGRKALAGRNALAGGSGSENDYRFADD